MKDIIKNIIKIDKDAIQREEDFKNTLEDLEQRKKLRLKEIKENIEVEVRSHLEEYQKKISIETELEIGQIRETSKDKARELQERYSQFEDKVIQDSFEMIIRNLEE
ncbi:hypothetical protein [Proteocatella sphenisci]|uniref:hypothetical protein n=1 Tax=Proteocatella sphenisci TaxID=181070 RepID=UPI00048E9702|nr:hypothetical protein [Proteocatella sphenisci]